MKAEKRRKINKIVKKFWKEWNNVYDDVDYLEEVLRKVLEEYL